MALPIQQQPHRRVDKIPKKTRGIWRKYKLNLGWVKRQRIIESGGDNPSQVCIMQAFSVASGQHYTDRPICVSDTITQLLIEANDSRSNNRERGRFKKLLPQILGTAPLKIVKKQEINKETGQRETVYYETKDVNDSAYRRLEKERKEIVKETLGDSFGTVYGATKTKDIIALVERLAKMKPERKSA